LFSRYFCPLELECSIRHASSPAIESVQSSSDLVKCSKESPDDYQELVQNTISDLEDQISIIDEACLSDVASDTAKKLEEERSSLRICLELVKSYVRGEWEESSGKLSSTIATEVRSMKDMPHVNHRRETPPDSIDDTGFFDNTAFGLGNVQIAVSTGRAKVAITNTAIGSNNSQFGGQVSDAILQQWHKK
jgi:hypothetical protein